MISNAGYALFGTIEESEEKLSRAQFDANFFGTLWVIQAALPHLRQQRGGHVLVTSSIAGIITFPTAGVYNATKWAVEGLAETLAAEVGEFGIKVTLIEPGGYAHRLAQRVGEHRAPTAGIRRFAGAAEGGEVLLGSSPIRGDGGLDPPGGGFERTSTASHSGQCRAGRCETGLCKPSGGLGDLGIGLESAQGHDPR